MLYSVTASSSDCGEPGLEKPAVLAAVEIGTLLFSSPDAVVVLGMEMWFSVVGRTASVVSFFGCCPPRTWQTDL
jgi:hypothetical protein